jgi:membrane protein implicated in regulation of membrane protease activity
VKEIKMEISQMMGFVMLLAVSTVGIIGASLFGHDGDVELSDGLSHGDSGPSLLSLRNLFLFGLGFGAAGAIATHLGMSLVMSCVFGGVSGLMTSLLGWLFYRTISKQQASTNTNTRSLIGSRATVSTRIPSGRMGQVVATDEHGSTVYLDARSSEGDHPFAEGDTVFITEASGNLVRVAKQLN